MLYLANRNIDADALRCVVDMAIFHDIDFKAPLVGPPVSTARLSMHGIVISFAAYIM